MTRISLACYVVPLAISLGACSSDTTGPQTGTGGAGSGGVPGDGGKTGSGGAGGTAGSSGQGGSTGGVTGTGGRSSEPTGGTTSSGGSVGGTGGVGTGGRSSGSTGGATGSGGATGNGGRTSAAGGTQAGGAGGMAGAGSGGAGPGTGGRSGTDAGAGRDGSAPGTGGQAGGAGGRSNADASPSTGGAGGGSGYNPCKASPCVILPLGDSITHGFGSSDDAGYRSALFKLVVAANQNVTFIGSLSNGPSTVSGTTFPKNHEGHDGISVTGITGYVPPKKAFTTTPHIVLLHIGTNDMTSNADPTTTANQLDTLVSNLVAAAPDALIAVAKIVPLGYNSSNWSTYNSKIPGIVQTHAGKGEHVILVEMSTMATSYIRGNGNVHPTDQGYAYMGNLWYEAIKGFLP
jgi:lysophospholipase L1-like esterase